MGIAIINLGKGVDRNAALVSDYTSLYSRLKGSTTRNVVVNGGGEMVGYSDQLHTPFNPQSAAGFVKRGGVWVDYCGFPFYFQGKSDGTVSTIAQSGWHQFAEYLGYGWLRDVSFFVNISEGFNPFASQKPYQIARGFPLSQSLDGACYCANCTYTIPGGLFGIGGLNGVVTANGYTGMVALHPKGGGYYFYGAWTPEAILLKDNKASQGIPIDTYSTFIRNVLSGNVSGYQCKPYKLAVRSTHHLTAGPTSPVKYSTFRSTAPRTSAASSPASTSHSGRVVEEILGGTLVVVGLGVGGVLVARKIHGRR